MSGDEKGPPGGGKGVARKSSCRSIGASNRTKDTCWRELRSAKYFRRYGLAYRLFWRYPLL